MTLNFLKRAIIRRMEKSGYSPFFAQKICKKRWEDFFHQKDTTLRQKIWAQKRGFYSTSIANFGLTEENYRDYVPDFEYYRLHPINGIFSRWIDDKLTIRYLLAPFSEFLPRYFYHLNGGEILRLPDCHKDVGQSFDDLINLLKTEKVLAAKPIASSEGKGFYKLSFENKRFFVNHEDVTLETLKTTLENWVRMTDGGYLITEYLHPCSELSKFWEDTPNSIRLSVIRDPHKAHMITGAHIRFGTQKTGLVDNANVGGVFCDIDLTDGRFFGGTKYEGQFFQDCHYHPDNHILMEGVVPNWSMIKEKILEISQYIPELIYMGYDIVVTDDGFKIIEINSMQGIAVFQSYFPLLKNEKTSVFFGRLLEEKRQLVEYRRSRTLFGKIRLFLQKCKIKLVNLKQNIFPKK